MRIKAKKKTGTGQNPTNDQRDLAQRVWQLPTASQDRHPASVESNMVMFAHVNTYGRLPDYYIDQPFGCRRCGKTGIWKASDQIWFDEIAQVRTNTVAVECHDCRLANRSQ